jgi:carbamoyltransferase
MRNRSNVDFRYIPHHLSHAALGYFTSTFDDAAVLVVDGQGEDVATTIYRARGTQLEEKLRFGISDSLGFFYATITRYLGFSPGSAGRTMGLAAYGSPTYAFPEVQLMEGGYAIRMNGRDKPSRMRHWMTRLEDVFGPMPSADFSMDRSSGLLRSPADLPDHLRNAAASTQAILERCISHLSEIAFKVTGSSNLVLSGGVALNCTSNGRLRETIGRCRLSVSGAVHDGGTALGAALAVAADCGDLDARAVTGSLFLGPSFDPDVALAHARRIGLVVQPPGDEVEASVGRLLAADKIGGWFRGRSEYGPRALGGRSIVARSDRPSVRDRVNIIKRRELWRPLSPAMTPAAAKALGVDGDGLDHMVEARWIGDTVSIEPVSGIVHVDRSIRPLIVREEAHPFSELLAAIEMESGAGAIINTSFNQEYEPIVNSPIDALRTFVTSDLDFLVLENVVLTKPA